MKDLLLLSLSTQIKLFSHCLSFVWLFFFLWFAEVDGLTGFKDFDGRSEVVVLLHFFELYSFTLADLPKRLARGYPHECFLFWGLGFLLGEVYSFACFERPAEGIVLLAEVSLLYV